MTWTRDPNTYILTPWVNLPINIDCAMGPTTPPGSGKLKEVGTFISNGGRAAHPATTLSWKDSLGVSFS